MSFVPTVIEICKIAICALILFYVVPMISAMPGNIQKIVQALIILIAIMYSLQVAMAGSPRVDRSMSMDRVPSIIAPERR